MAITAAIVKVVGENENLAVKVSGHYLPPTGCSWELKMNALKRNLW